MAAKSKLVIVESPTKAKTIGKYLGKGYTVKASYGHVRDLPKSKLGVDVEHDFVPQYLIPRDKNAVVKDLKKEVKAADEILLATDPDREGEAIAWHLLSATGLATPENGKRIGRVVFHEITKEAVKEALKHPRDIDMNLVNAQQTRRILDRLVGYKISPILWKKVKKGLSAGRVQSVAVRLIVDREREVAAFNPEEYWTIETDFRVEKGKNRKAAQFHAALNSINGQKASLKTEAEAAAVLNELQGALYCVSDIRQRQISRNPSAPFTTSTLQQEANRKLNFTSKRTMGIAQSLYEGVELGEEGALGLITYMRTDSTNVAAVAQQEARQVIEAKYGKEYMPEQPPVYTRKSKNAQEAHEAIRPTSIARDPESLKPFLSPEQYKLYRLIWQRFLASQMAPAQLDSTSVDVKADTRPLTELVQWRYLFRATGSVIRFAGFLAVYQESLDEDAGEDELSKKALPALEIKEILDLVQLLPEQHFTQPPARYTEASLVRALEEMGIGRPSTYAPTLSTVQERYYITKIEKHFQPTELGMLVNDLLVDFFPDIVDINFTSQMEDNLDEIAGGQKQWQPVLAEFYKPFEITVVRAETEMSKVELKPEYAGEDCEKCGRPMLIRMSKFGKFIACSGFPECRNAKPLLKSTKVACPQCHQGEILVKKTRKRRIFYGCSLYPECTFSLWERPISQPCPECGNLMTLSGRNRAKCTSCGTLIDYEIPEEEQELPLVRVSPSSTIVTNVTEKAVS
ncbi:MAG: type I DNA topoisomerase [Chloroflexi bacterium]|uniref:DNA topoisomerase 1 n=1 Tax=Candidatus Chlorohelix allophototropha TaxID=3003348 RepID=A0A8T7M7P4_9CHLR|nr:type I DNA topoisomerase [Chloroflexota bacterium]WJW68078.1 type I DNA topoisomerase [Chloroflexota bacterium L227-S17]